MTDKDLTLKYQNANNKLILLDYDGTLVNYHEYPENAKPSEKLIDVLLQLYSKPHIKLIIITGRSYLDIDNFFGKLPIDVIAEHGAMLKKKGKWEHTFYDNGLWKKKIYSLFYNFSIICPGCTIEEKDFSIAWHYRNAHNEWDHDYSRELISLLEKIIDLDNFKILDGNKVIEVISKNIGKGIAVKKMVEQNNFDFILSVGDDITDEEMFKYLLFNDNAVTIKVGNDQTLAKYRLEKVEDVISLLEQLSLLN